MSDSHDRNPAPDRNARSKSSSYDRDREYKSKISQEVNYITYEQARQLAEEISDEKTSRLFRELGVDISDFKDSRNLREDLIFLRASREAGQERRTTYSKSLITSAIGGLVGLIFAAISWVFMNIHK